LAVNQVGFFNYRINGTQIEKDGPLSLRKMMINYFLIFLIYLEPLNLFLYTWLFLSELELVVSGPATKTFIKWFARITIFLIPAAFYSILPVYIVEYARTVYYFFHLNPEEANHYGNIKDALY
jgi:hypothetical protein